MNIINKKRVLKERIQTNILSLNTRTARKFGAFKIYDLPEVEETSTKEEEKLADRAKFNSIVDASNKMLLPSLEKTNLKGKNLKDISTQEWRGYFRYICESRQDLQFHQKAKFFFIKLVKTSPEFFKGWNFNTARIYDDQFCNWSLIWSEANKFFGSHWEIKEKQNLSPDPSRKNKQKKKLL